MSAKKSQLFNLTATLSYMCLSSALVQGSIGDAYPAGGFQLQAYLDTENKSSISQVHEVIARDDVLYFLVAPGSTPENTRLIRTNVVGEIEKIINLGPDYVTNVLTNASGDPFVSSVNSENVSKLVRLTSEGRVVSEMPIDTLSPNRLMSLSRGIITVSSAGRVTTESGSQLGTLPVAEGKGPLERVLPRGK